ncbi:hypothetical protein CDAR_562561 [Caerostris darwini]|uniref:Uncharacterized protein n=1 Tax=Caerostris darwini TaxID=1538125 RepID=A0AAV4X7B4_9ARAC|nr:hypothetical protein CDAR_562561 [Caerostris darwini]
MSVHLRHENAKTSSSLSPHPHPLCVLPIDDLSLVGGVGVGSGLSKSFSNCSRADQSESRNCYSLLPTCGEKDPLFQISRKVVSHGPPRRDDLGVVSRPFRLIAALRPDDSHPTLSFLPNSTPFLTQ